MLEAQLNAKLLTREDRLTHEILLDMSALCTATRPPGSPTAGMRNMGCLNADRILSMERLNPVPAGKGGDIYLVQGQYIPLDQVGLRPLKPATVEKNSLDE